MEKMRTNLIKDVVHLRDTLFRRINDKVPEDDTFRVDYFTLADIGDEVIVKLLNERI